MATSARVVGPKRALIKAGCEFGENSHRDSIWKIPLNSSRVSKAGTTRKKPMAVSNEWEEEMDAYRIDRFGSVDGIVLRSNEDPPGRTEGGPDEGARELAQLSGSDGPQRWRSRSDEARRDTAFRRCG